MPNYTQLIQQIKQLDRDSLLRLSGFLDGLLIESVPVSTSENTESEIKPRKILVAFASQSGNAEAIASELSEALQTIPGNEVHLTHVAELNIKKLPQYSHLLMVASTHGEGDPPDTAIEFYEQFKSNRAPNLAGVEHGVIALGDSSYEHFCSFGIWIDKRLSELGAKPFIERLDCDVDYDTPVQAWQADMLRRLSTSSTPQAHPRAADTQNSNQKNYTMKKPLEVEVISNIDLCTDKANKRVHHLELELPSTEIDYLPGDSLGISINNPEDMVEELLDRFKQSGNEPIDFNHTTYPLKECLTKDAELFRITQKQLNLLLEKHPNKKLKTAIDNTQNSAEFIFSHDWLSVLDYYNKNPFSQAQDFVNILNPQGQRLYSIASSPIAHQDEVHLAIRLREFGDDKRLGLVSDKVSQLASGDKVHVYLKPNKNFRLTKDPSTPFIMIGSGTGIAPFRAFLYQRLELGISSPAWLFFGEQSFRNSFLYQTDWLKLLDKKALTNLTLAFSRDAKQKLYVQDRLREHAKEVYKWLDEGAIIYVCGSADGMAPAVHTALIDIISEQSGINLEAATQKLQQMMIEGQYKRDVY